MSLWEVCKAPGGPSRFWTARKTAAYDTQVRASAGKDCRVGWGGAVPHSTARKARDHNVAQVAESDHPLPGDDAVRAQLEKLLASSRFMSSPRCQILLQHIVEEALRGNVESLKERNLGIEVFRRDAAYDTNADPVVRIAASEVRKKLAQYYYEPGNQRQIRIAIPVGSYAPEFSFPDSAVKNGSANHWTQAEEHDAVEVAEETVVALPQVAPTKHGKRTPALIVSASILAILCIGGVLWRAMTVRSPLDRFWAPIVVSRSPILLCLGQMRASIVELDPIPSRNPGESAMPIIGPNGIANAKMPIAVLDDSITLANVAGLLRSEHKQLIIRPEAITSYEDLQKGPVVLVGALNNDWTLRLMRNMRFQFNQDAQMREWWVSDQKNPGVKLGRLVLTDHMQMTQDLAVVARILDPETKQPTIIVAGLAPEGTLAAGNFVTDPQYWKDSAGSLPANWQNKNLEILLSVNVIDGQPGPPRIVTSVVW